MPRVPDWLNQLTQRVIGCAIEVHTLLGPGLLESLYERALAYELVSAGLKVECQVPIVLKYKGQELGDLRVDMIVERVLIVELKCVERVHDAHLAQLLSYLRSTDLPLGLLINFHHPRLVDGISRRINPRSPLLNPPPPL